MKDNIIAGKYCPLCGSEGSEYGYKDGFLVRICDCVKPGALLSFQFGTKEYTDMYRDIQKYHTEIQEKENLPISIERDGEHLIAGQKRIELISLVLNNEYKTLLDMGCGTGAFVDAAKQHGYEALGLEICEGLVEWSYNKGRNVKCGSWESIEGKWDIITFNDVLEHLTKPIKCLKKMHDSLSENGVLIIEIPEFACNDSLEQGVDWKHVRPAQHLWLPSHEVLVEVFKTLDFKIKHVVRPLNGKLGKVSYFLSAF